MDRLEKIQELLDAGFTTTEIGEELGITRQAVWLNMRRYNLDHSERRLRNQRHQYYFERRKG